MKKGKNQNQITIIIGIIIIIVLIMFMGTRDTNIEQTAPTGERGPTGISRGEAESIAWNFANKAYLSDCAGGCRRIKYEIEVVDSTQIGDKWKVVAYYFIDYSEERRDPSYNLEDVKVAYSLIIDKKGNIESSNIISSTY